VLLDSKSPVARRSPGRAVARKASDSTLAEASSCWWDIHNCCNENSNPRVRAMARRRGPAVSPVVLASRAIAATVPPTGRQSAAWP
jgi:hypothetical protein